MLDDRPKLNWLRVTASGIADRTADFDRRQSDMAWNNWLVDGPSKSLGRLHRLSRTATGWIPSKLQATPNDTDDPVDDEDNGGVHDGALDFESDNLTENDVAWATAVTLDLQAAVDQEASGWSKEWLADDRPQPFLWPKHLSPDDRPPAICLDIARRASLSFPRTVGLGWDKLHPRVFLRCSDEAVLAMLRFLMLVEIMGSWPQTIGIILICLIPKADGGRRPIGLLPSIIRGWMRIRLDLVRSWQSEHDRPYFYAGPGRGADIASWRQAARAELAASSRLMSYGNAMLDLVKAFERVPHDWLAHFAHKYNYPVLVLRLCIDATWTGRPNQWSCV